MDRIALIKEKIFLIKYRYDGLKIRINYNPITPPLYCFRRYTSKLLKINSTKARKAYR